MKSDIHIVLDDVQFEKNSVTNRNKLRTPSGWTWLTVPILTKGKFENLQINKIQIDNTKPWGRKHIGTLNANYGQAPFYSTYLEFFKELYSRKWENLNSLIMHSTEYFFNDLNIKTKRLPSSDFAIGSKKSQLISDLCKEVGATTYLSGPFGRYYLDTREFEEAGINIQFHDYEHPVYTQNFSGFESNMSIIDLLLNHGKNSLKILQS